ncbi:aspartic peptidase domain-containing protein [Suillus spraguei]|nr:aspartic peptidase domain-containing protein [Suillus spraguei]
MFLAASLLTQVLLTSSITGSPIEVHNSLITIPLTRRLKFSNGTINLSQHDNARMAAFRNYNTRRQYIDIIPVSNIYYGYNIAVDVGSPPTTYNLAIDTGSSITWLRNSAYVQTVTSVKTRQRVRQAYGYDSDYDNDGDGDDDEGEDDSEGEDEGEDDDGDEGDKVYVKGTIWKDTVTLGGWLTVIAFPLTIAEIVKGIEEDEIGILGLGPRTLSLGALIDEPHERIPTITDYLHKQGRIDQRIVGVFFQPTTTEADSLCGELSFGGPDKTKCIGNIVYTRVTTIPTASNYWGINQKITYGSTEILGTTAGIIDSGSTFLYIASDAFEQYQTATGGIHDEITGHLTITLTQYMALQNLNFHIEGQIFSLSRNAQIWPRPLNYKLHGNADLNAIYLIVKDIGTRSGTGEDFNLGYVFLQRFYTVFDSSSSPGRVGFAKTLFTDITTHL